MASGLHLTDVFVRDKQNVAAAVRILDPKVRACLERIPNTLGTRIFLKIGESIRRSFEDRTLSVKERTFHAWLPVVFVRLWRSWIEIMGYSKDHHFISQQTHDDVILLGHSVILALLVFDKYYPNQNYHQYMFGSDACEKVFGQIRSFVRGKSNFTLLDMIDYAGRIQKLEELKKKKTFPVENVQILDVNDIIDGMKSAEKELLVYAEKLGMVDALVKAKLVNKLEDGIALINLDYCGSKNDWTQKNDDEPDENEVADCEEMYDLSNGILLDALQLDVDNSAGNSVASVVSESVIQEEDEDYDESDPKQCAFFASGKCVHSSKKSGKRKGPLNWIQCNHQTCLLWFHSECVGIEFDRILKNEDYVFTCPRQHSEAPPYRVTLRENISVSEEITVESAQASLSFESSRKCQSGVNFIRFEGNVYHISRLLSMLEGKAYNPSASRSERWKSQNYSNYFEKLASICSSADGSDEMISLGDVASFWVPNEGYRHGIVVRIYKKISRQSNHALTKSKEFKSIDIYIKCCRFSDEKEIVTSDRFYSMSGKALVTKSQLKDFRVGAKHINALKKQKDKLEKLDENASQKRRKVENDEEELAKNTIPVLKEILEKNGISYKSKDRKQDLILKLKDYLKNKNK